MAQLLSAHCRLLWRCLDLLCFLLPYALVNGMPQAVQRTVQPRSACCIFRLMHPRMSVPITHKG